MYVYELLMHTCKTKVVYVVKYYPLSSARLLVEKEHNHDARPTPEAHLTIFSKHNTTILNYMIFLF